MPLLTENQLTDIVNMIVDDYGSRLTGGEVSEVTGILDQTLTSLDWLLLTIATNRPISPTVAIQEI